MKTIQKTYIVAILLLSSVLILFFQNCGSSPVQFTETISPASVSSSPDFKVVYTETVQVGGVGSFSVEANSDDLQVESTNWQFSDSQKLDGKIVSRLFNSVGKISFDVEVRFVGEETSVVKKNLYVDVQSGTTSCLDLNNIKILSDLVDFSESQPQWYIDKNNKAPLHVRLNFSTCLHVHLYNVSWHVYSEKDLSSPVFSFYSHEADIPFDLVGKYKIEAQVVYGGSAKAHSTDEMLDVVDGTNLCKPEAGIYSDVSPSKVVVGQTVVFNSRFPQCLGYNGKISWFLGKDLISNEISFSHTFTSAGKYKLRADVEKMSGGKVTIEQYALDVEVSSQFNWFCASCGGKLECRDGASNGVVDEAMCSDKPINFSCTDVCISDQ